MNFVKFTITLIVTLISKSQIIMVTFKNFHAIKVNLLFTEFGSVLYVPYKCKTK